MQIEITFDLIFKTKKYLVANVNVYETLKKSNHNKITFTFIDGRK